MLYFFCLRDFSCDYAFFMIINLNLFNARIVFNMIQVPICNGIGIGKLCKDRISCISAKIIFKDERLYFHFCHFIINVPCVGAIDLSKRCSGDFKCRKAHKNRLFMRQIIRNETGTKVTTDTYGEYDNTHYNNIFSLFPIHMLYPFYRSKDF